MNSQLPICYSFVQARYCNHLFRQVYASLLAYCRPMSISYILWLFLALSWYNFMQNTQPTCPEGMMNELLVPVLPILNDIRSSWCTNKDLDAFDGRKNS